jgi:hypothetical protein
MDALAPDVRQEASQCETVELSLKLKQKFLSRISLENYIEFALRFRVVEELISLLVLIHLIQPKPSVCPEVRK